jgi:hypothetical protein
MTVLQFAQAAYVYCQKTAGSCTSWGRTVKHSIAVGGFDGDPHTWWVGADIVYDTLIDEQQAKKLAQSLGLLLIREKDHDHLQPLGYVNRPH